MSSLVALLFALSWSSTLSSTRLISGSHSGSHSDAQLNAARPSSVLDEGSPASQTAPADASTDGSATDETATDETAPASEPAPAGIAPGGSPSGSPPSSSDRPAGSSSPTIYLPEPSPPQPVRIRARPAPESNTSPPLLEAIEVTSTQVERPVDESPVPVLVLQRRDLERSGTLDLSRALDQAPGVTLAITANSARGGGPGVSIQGLSGKQVLVLLNGRPFLGDFDGEVDVTTIPVSIIERIEVVAGPMAVMYGAGAVGGVVNIITRLATYGSGGPHLSSSSRFGTYNTLDSSHALAYGASTMSLLAVGSYAASDGFDLDPTRIDTNGDRYRRSSLFGSLDWRPAPSLDLRLDTLYQTSDRLRVYADDQYLSTIGKTYYHNWAFDERRLFSTLSMEWTRSRFWVSGWVSGGLYQRLGSDQVQGGLEASYRDADAKDLIGRIQFTSLVGGSGFVLGGIEGRHQGLEMLKTDVTAEGEALEPDAEVPASQLTQLEAFALADATFFGDHLEVYGGVRLNYTNRFGFYPPSVLNVRWRPLNFLNLRSNLGLGYRTPTLKELNYEFDHSSLGYVVHGNPALLPEQSLNARLSAELDWKEKGLLRAGFFYNDVINLIDYGDPTVENGIAEYQLTNVMEGVLTQGLEAIGSTRVGSVSLTAAWQVLDARYKDTGLQLLYRAHHTGKVNATWQLGDSGLELSGVARYLGAQFVDNGGDIDDPDGCLYAYREDLLGSSWNRTTIATAEGACYVASRPFVVLDATAQARFQLASGPLTLVFYGGANNLLNVVRDPSALTTTNTEGSQTLDVRPMPGRTFFFGLRGDL